MRGWLPSWFYKTLPFKLFHTSSLNADTPTSHLEHSHRHLLSRALSLTPVFLVFLFFFPRCTRTRTADGMMKTLIGDPSESR